MEKHEPTESLTREVQDPIVSFLNKVVVFCVRVLAILMVLVIVWGVVDVVVHLYRMVSASIASAYNVDNLINSFGVFLAVLIAIEVFLNIIFYLKRDAIHVPLVVATALTAVARKVIVIDYSTLKVEYLYGTALVIIALGITYWLVTKDNVHGNSAH